VDRFLTPRRSHGATRPRQEVGILGCPRLFPIRHVVVDRVWSLRSEAVDARLYLGDKLGIPGPQEHPMGPALAARRFLRTFAEVRFDMPGIYRSGLLVCRRHVAEPVRAYLPDGFEDPRLQAGACTRILLGHRCQAARRHSLVRQGSHRRGTPARLWRLPAASSLLGPLARTRRA